MARTYKIWIVKDRPDGGGYQGGAQPDELKTSITINYAVLVEDDTPGFDGRYVDVFEILARTSFTDPSIIGYPLPLVNGSSYYNNTSGYVNPFLICRSKTANRDPGNKRLWHVSTAWSTGANAATTEEDNQGQTPPPVIDDLTPRYEFRLDEDTKSRSTDEDDKICLTPTDNEYPEPFIERIATQILTVHVYASSISYKTMQDRKFKLNKSPWNTYAANRWIILDVAATEVWVQLTAGPFLAALVTYTLALHPEASGWVDTRELVDTHYLESVGGRKMPFTDGTTKTLVTGKVNADGTQNENALMYVSDFRLQPSVDFTFIPAPTAQAARLAGTRGAQYENGTRVWGTL